MKLQFTLNGQEVTAEVSPLDRLLDVLRECLSYTGTKEGCGLSLIHISGCYNIPNAHVSAKVVATNTPPNGAFRGFGAPQSIFAMERQMDKIARTCLLYTSRCV